MDESETMRRVVGILTRAKELAEADEEDDTEEGDAIIGSLMCEMLRADAMIAPDATAQDISDAVSRALHAPLAQLVACFSIAFLQLAALHDEGRTDISSADVLRELALYWQTPQIP